MKTSNEINEIATALSAVQGEIKNPANTATAKVLTKQGKEYSYDYAPLPDILNTVRPLLAAHGLSVVQSALADGSAIGVTTMLLHSSGQWIETDPLFLPLQKPTAQDAGGAVTYARRYTLSALLGISSEDDDDAAAASGTVEPPREQKPPKPEQKPAKPEQKPAKTDRTQTNAEKAVFADLCGWALKNALDPEKAKDHGMEFLRAKFQVDSIAAIPDNLWPQIREKLTPVYEYVEAQMVGERDE